VDENTPLEKVIDATKGGWRGRAQQMAILKAQLAEANARAARCAVLSASAVLRPAAAL
jgi:hypothetical protein